MTKNLVTRNICYSMSGILIGLSGFAESGKDTFFKLLADKIPNCKKFALADQLKSELQPFIMDSYGVDITNCSRQEKDFFRGFLIAHAACRRQSTRGKYWHHFIEAEVINHVKSGGISVITDIRHTTEIDDDIFWLKRLGGISVHISKYEMVSNNNKKRPEMVKRFFPAPNSTEKKNNPILLQEANYKVTWPKLNQGEIEENVLSPYVNNFIKWLSAKVNR